MKTPKNQLNRLAKQLGRALLTHGSQLTHTQCLEVAANLLGQKNLHTLQAQIGEPTPKKEEDEIRAWVEKITKESDSEPEIVARPVRLHQFRVSVLLDDKSAYDPDIETLAYDITQGSCIGDVEKIGEIDLTPQEVAPILLHIGNDGEYFGEPAPSTKEGEVFLTNAMGDDTGHIQTSDLDALGLEYDRQNDFPLTEKEQKLLRGDLLVEGVLLNTNYSTLWNGQKYHCPSATFPYTQKNKEEKQREAEKAKESLGKTARRYLGDIVTEDYESTFFVRLRLPFSQLHPV